jgi:putative isomerase
MYNLEKVPFSRFGSYFSIAVNDWGGLEHGMYLRSHYGSVPHVFKMYPVRDGAPVEYTTETSPSLLTLKADGGGTVECVIEGQDTIRLRGSGVQLRLEMPPRRWNHAYELPGGWCFNLNPDNLQIGLDLLHGSVDMDAPWEKGKGFCWESSYITATLSPDDDKGFDVALDNFVTTWVKPDERPDFDSCRQEVEQEYAAWQQGLPQAPAEYETTRDLAAYVNWSATLAPAGQLKRPTMLMSKMDMPNVYHWDHAFNAMAHSTHQPDLAWDQLMLFHDYKDEHGKPPSNMNRSRMGSTIFNPPVQGWALRRMWDANPGMFTPQRLVEAYDYLSNWTDWICNTCTWPGDVLPFYKHGFDSGWDNSSIFDKGVPVATPDLASHLILQMETLTDIAEALQRNKEKAAWQMRRDELLTALVDELWQEDRFVGKLKPSNTIVECQSLITCMPMELGRRLPKEIQQALVARLRQHQTEHGLATEVLDSPNYVEGGYWRGPIWAPVTMLIVNGLLDIDETDLARQIVDGFCNMCRDNGFYENFDPVTGKGYYDPAYTWTSSVFMIFANQLHQKQL